MAVQEIIGGRTAARRGGMMLSALLAAMAVASCSGNTPSATSVQGPTPPPVAAVGSAPPARFRGVNRPPPATAPSFQGQWMLRSPSPPKVVADNSRRIGTAAEAATDARRNYRPEPRKGVRWIDSARVGVLRGTPEGRDFMTMTTGGRALVRGTPAESCPAFIAISRPSEDGAVRAGLRQCFDALNGRAECGCQVVAQGNQLLAREDDLSYAIGVTAELIAPGRNADLVAEERAIENSPGARRVWLLTPLGPLAMAQLEPDGRAALIFGDDGPRYDGRHVVDGFRRGRFARRLFLTNQAGERLVALIGYEPSELEERRSELAAWPARFAGL